jgi:hypothetical protein
MSVNEIGASMTAAAQRVATGDGSVSSAAGTGKVDLAKAAAQEALETHATTVKEAQHGDRVAIRKLQQEQDAKQQQADQEKTSEAGKGELVDKSA